MTLGTSPMPMTRKNKSVLVYKCVVRKLSNFCWICDFCFIIHKGHCSRGSVWDLLLPCKALNLYCPISSVLSYAYHSITPRSLIKVSESKCFGIYILLKTIFTTKTLHNIDKVDSKVVTDSCLGTW